jgi:16S rRNA (guanine966-N2)-methyltransferase
MSVRVIAGSAKGRNLEVPDAPGLRPTSGRLKQVLFDLLGDLGGLAVLDLYAGSGQLGIEALSRGAASATFVESNPKALQAIKANLARCGFQGQVISRPVLRFLQTEHPADLVFVDPPYDSGLGSLTAALEALARSIPPEATVAIEAPPGLMLPSGYLERRRRRAGSTELVLATTICKPSPFTQEPSTP